MSHRRPEDPRQSGLENVLRNALRLAVDAVEPAADGLDIIRAKIAVRRGARVPGWRTWPPVVILLSLLHRLDPAVIWTRQAARVVVQRFKPEPGRAGALGWIGWLRPAAAVATGLFVVAAASWAIAALPQVIAPATNHHQIQPGGGGGGGGGPAPTSKSASNTGPGGSVAPSATGPVSPSRSCTATPTASPTSSGTPSISPSPSPTSSPSPSTSPSPSPSQSSTSGSPSPSVSPTTTGATVSPTSPTGQTGLAGAAVTSSGTAGTRDAASGLSSASSVTSPAPPAHRLSASRCG